MGGYVSAPVLPGSYSVAEWDDTGSGGWVTLAGIIEGFEVNEESDTIETEFHNQTHANYEAGAHAKSPPVTVLLAHPGPGGGTDQIDKLRTMWKERGQASGKKKWRIVQKAATTGALMRETQTTAFISSWNENYEHGSSTKLMFQLQATDGWNDPAAAPAPS